MLIMQTIFRFMATALVAALVIFADSGRHDAVAATSEGVEAFSGFWSGTVFADCSGGDSVMEFTVDDGELSGTIVARGMSEGNGTYILSGYVDRRGRISEGRMLGPFAFSLTGKLTDGKGKGRFLGGECMGSWRVDLVKPAIPAEEPESAAVAALGDAEQAPQIAAQEVVADTAAPLIAVPASLETDSAVIEISGGVVDASQIIELRIDGRPVAIGEGGTFTVQRGVAVGISDISVSALDEWGNEGRAVIRVSRSAPPVAAAEAASDTATAAPEEEIQLTDLGLGSYHALVIGNNDYSEMPRLNTAVADAEAVSRVLAERYGFEVTTLLNATRYDMIGAMSKLRASLTFDTNLLIYYAGHGVIDPVTERGYWLPVEAEQDNPANWVSNDDITDMLKAIPARHILVIADSCYSGTLVRAAPVELDTWEEQRDWLKRIVTKRSRTALASGGLEPVADAGSGGHSVFATALLAALKENSEIVEAQELFAPVRRSVVLNANQTPVYSDIRLAGHDGGDFVFAPR
jgi:hypothetical protein